MTTIGSISTPCQPINTVRKNDAVSFEGETHLNSYGEKASTLKRIPLELAIGSSIGAGLVKLINYSYKKRGIVQNDFSNVINEAGKLNKKAALVLVGVTAVATTASTELPKVYFKAVDTISAKIFGGNKKD